MNMTNAVSEEKWTEIKITVATKDIETAGNIANMVVPYGIYIEDYSALEEETMEIAHIDLIEESLLKKDRTKGIIHIYVNPHENPLEATSFLKERLDSEGIEHKIEVGDCLTEDWQNNWKQYYHAMPIGKKLMIRPLWENEFDADGRKVLNIEPGLAFGTGSHPTTKLCLETLENYVNDGTTVLDIGCGSGILSIAALLLGARSALGVDIGSLAVKTAVSNAKENGFDYTPVKDQATTLMEIKSGTCDAAIIDSLMAAAMVGEGTNYADLTYTVSLNSEEYGVGFRKGSDVTELFNAFLAKAKTDGTVDTIAEKYGVSAALIK